MDMILIRSRSVSISDMDVLKKVNIGKKESHV